MSQLKGKVSDPVLSQAKLLAILPLGYPVRVSGETEMSLEEEGPDAMEEEIIVTEKASDAVAMDDIMAMDVAEGAEEPLGDAMATGISRKRSQREDEDDVEEPPQGSLRIACLRMDEGAVCSVAAMTIPSMRTDESITRTRNEHIQTPNSL